MSPPSLRHRGVMVRAIPGDVTDAAHRERLVAAARDLGGIDLLVNNASTLGPSPLPGLADYPLDALARGRSRSTSSPRWR